MSIKNILVIEDDRDTIEMIELCFRKYWPEAKVIPAYLGLEGLEMVARGKIDTVILDLGLPDINGFEVLKQLCLTSQAQVVILSVTKEDSARVRAFEFGADAYITKPFSPLELVIKTKELSERKTRAPKANRTMNKEVV